MDLYRITFEYKEKNSFSQCGRFVKGLYTLDMLPAVIERMNRTGLYQNIRPEYAGKAEEKKEGEKA